jgi:intracellular septation protein A
MDKNKKSIRNALIATVGCDIVGPLALFYLLRAAGLGLVVASLLVSVVPLGSVVVQFVRRRQLDQVACLTIAVLLLVVVLALVSSDQRLVLAKDGFITGIIGVWALGTLLSRRPLYFAVARPFGEEAHENWDEQWTDDAGFRHRIRTITSVWGIGLTLDALVKVMLA